MSSDEVLVLVEECGQCWWDDHRSTKPQIFILLSDDHDSTSIDERAHPTKANKMYMQKQTQADFEDEKCAYYVLSD